MTTKSLEITAVHRMTKVCIKTKPQTITRAARKFARCSFFSFAPSDIFLYIEDMRKAYSRDYAKGKDDVAYDIKEDEVAKRTVEEYADYGEHWGGAEYDGYSFGVGGFKDGYKAAMERMLGENQKLREQLEQAQQKATSLDALNYAIENHPNERLAETVSKNAAEMIKWANYTMEHGHVQPKSIDTKDIVILPIEPGKYKPGQAKETLLSDFKLDGLKEVASTLEERYALFNGRQMCAVACEPTAEGIVTYMSAVKEIFDKNPEYSAGSPIPRIVHDARTLINDDIEAVQQIADGIEMNRFLKEQEAKQNEHEKNIEKDVVQKDENNKDVGAAIGED